MGTSYMIALAPRSKVDAVEWEAFPGNLPGVLTETVAQLLKSCPFLKHDGRTFWGDDLEEFELNGEKTQCIWMEVHGDPQDEISGICQALAKALGPVTLLSSHSDDRVEVKAGMTAEEIWKKM